MSKEARIGIRLSAPKQRRPRRPTAEDDAETVRVIAGDERLGPLPHSPEEMAASVRQYVRQAIFDAPRNR